MVRYADFLFTPFPTLVLRFCPARASQLSAYHTGAGF